MQGKRKKRLVTTVGVFAICALLLGITVGCLYSFNRPSVTFDFSQKTGAVTNGASGFLYGFAEPDIPSREIAESIGVSTLSTKAYGGLQHPIGDVNQVADTFLEAGGKQIIVYSQDMYDTWYYQFDSLEQYHERVRQTVTETAKTDYADKVVYCIYNEMDNGEWFGDFSKPENRLKTYEAWKETYALVRSIDPNAKIGGPGYKRYNSADIKEFLEFCKAENCLPDTMIWHELGTNSLYMFEEHFSDYAELCEELYITKRPVCISEYGLMETNGIPGESVKWISRIENAKAEGCVAYWRLADNLSDVAADDVTPNSNWWAYHWYAGMTGQTVESEAKDLFQSNMGKFLTFRSKGLKYKGFTGLATVDENAQNIQILAGGSNRNSDIVLEKLDATESFKDAKSVWVSAEYVDYKGLGGAVYHPQEAFLRLLPVENGTVKIELNDILYTQCYRLTVTPLDVDYENRSLSTVPYEKDESSAMRRYEAENAKLFGTAAVKDNVPYAASEGKMVCLNSAEPSGAEFTVEVSESGSYSCDLVFGNGANGMLYNEDGTLKDKGIRSDLTLTVIVDGKVSDFPLNLPSTIKDDYTDCVTFFADLEKGKHTIRFELSEAQAVGNTLSLDFLDVAPNRVDSDYIENVGTVSATHPSECICVTEANAYYSLQIAAPTAPTQCTLNGITLRNIHVTALDNGNYNCKLYLRRGVNHIQWDTPNTECLECVLFYGDEDGTSTVFPADAFTLSGSAVVKRTEKTIPADFDGLETETAYADGIASDRDGAVSIAYTAPSDGYYQLTFAYSNNEEGGAHDYNVDLVERYITLSVNGEVQGNTYFRSTYSWDTYKTKTVSVYLHAGENIISYTNDGSYRFNGKTAFAPHISSVTVSPAVMPKR